MEVRFMTSRTLVKNFFPPGVLNFTFATPGSRSICSFVSTKVCYGEGLAFRSYHTLALHLHDVSWHALDGEKTSGVYMPILFEDSAHNVVRDRERHDLPAMYGNIKVARDENSYTVTAGIDTFQWARIVLENLEPTEPESSHTTTGISVSGRRGKPILTWKSVSGLREGQDGQAIQISGSIESEQTNIQKLWTAKKATVILESTGGHVPSITSHVIERLVEIPINEVLGAEVAEGTCKWPFHQA